MNLIHEIQGKLKVYWHQDCQAVVDVWENYYVRVDEFHEAVLVKGMQHSIANGGKAWIVDSSGAEGKFAKHIIDYIGTDVFPEFVRNGIKYFITIRPKASPVASFNVTSYSMKTADTGLKLVEMESLDQALEWLSQQV